MVKERRCVEALAEETHLVVHRPSHVLQIAVVEEGIAVEFHPHTDLFYTDRPDFRYRVTVQAQQDVLLNRKQAEYNGFILLIEEVLPISVNKHSFENCIHHVFNLVLIFLKLQKENTVPR